MRAPNPPSLILRIQYRTKAGPMQFAFAGPEFSWVCSINAAP